MREHYQPQQPPSRRDDTFDRPVELSPRAILRAREIEESGRIPSAVDPEGPPAEIPLDRLDPDALRVVYRLRAFGHQAYLVGGCVRDLSLGMKPKDFDVATSAHPGEIRAIFRNCRLIGRRFRLAHVYFKGGKVVETATFRANPNEELGPEESSDLLITRDNVFGTAEEDARRRDFTVNGLFYDVVLGRVIDYVGGREDLALRRIRTIGDPDVRFREDPIRILRAFRFAAKCGFTIEEETFAAIRRHVGDIARCSPPRVLEEIFRLLRSGTARRCFELLHETGALPVLLPPLAEFVERAAPEEARSLFVGLGLLDDAVAQGPLPDDAVILSALLVHLSRRELIKEGWRPDREGAPRESEGPAAETTQPAPEPPAAQAEGSELPPVVGAPETGEGLTAAAPFETVGGESGGEPTTAGPDAPAGGEVAEAENGETAEDLEAEAAAESPLPAEPTEEEAPKVPWSASAAATSVEALLAELVRTARLPRRIAERARLLLFAQRILSGVKRRRGSPLQFAKQSYFADALLVFELYVRSTGQGFDQLERWKARQAQALGKTKPATASASPEDRTEGPAGAMPAKGAPSPAPGAPAAEAPADGGEGRRRRRRGGRRRRGQGAGEGELFAEETVAVANTAEPAVDAPPIAAASPVASPAPPLPPRPERASRELFGPPPGPADLFPF